MLELLSLLALCAMCTLLGLAAAGLWVWRQDRLERLQINQASVKLKQEFTDSIAQVAQIHNKTAVDLTALQDRLQAVEMGINAQRR